MKILKTVPIFYHDALEPRLDHWCQLLGYQVVAEVPHGEHLGFVILVREGSEIMLQTYASAADDTSAAIAPIRAKGVAFYHETDDVAAIAAKLDGPRVRVALRDTSYGMRELFVEDEAGFLHGYAQRL